MTIGLYLLPLALAAVKLPDQYNGLLEAGLAPVEKRLAAEPPADLKTLETLPGWRHFPSAILAAAVVRRVELATRIGDLLVRESEAGAYQARLDHHRDTYLWIEAYRLLEPKLDEPRRARWRRELERNISELAAECALRQDFPWYNSPYIRTSPNSPETNLSYAVGALSVPLQLQGGKGGLRPNEQEITFTLEAP